MAILSVKNLIISFKTNNGTVKAVRDVSFDIEKGETLAIVGESGSGKSVSMRAVMGILAGNAIVEGGEILYSGMDLLKISEDDFHHIRGNKISMIFQDTLSSLNPIIKVGKQLTEAMILNGKANQRESKVDFEDKLKVLETAMNGAYEHGYEGASTPEKTSADIKILTGFVGSGNELEARYNAAYDHAQNTINNIRHILIQLINQPPKAVGKLIDQMLKPADKVYDEFLIRESDEEYKALLAYIKAEKAVYVSGGDKEVIKGKLNELSSRLSAACEREKPNFFTLGYSVYAHPETAQDYSDIAALNARTRQVLDDEFMLDFLKGVRAGVKYSFDVSIENKKKAVAELEAARKYLSENVYDPARDEKAYNKLVETLSDSVESGIDRLDIDKDSYAYTFRTTFGAAMDTYVRAQKLEKRKAAGRHIPKKQRQFADNINMELYQHNIELTIDKVVENYNNQIEKAATADFSNYGIEIIDYIKDKASKMVYKVTKTMAKDRAISLMEEVGIPEPRKRYKQYPFQFSGGMRQRVVIAIALSANPDILICDEPTTALDVTIQAQILELINELKRERQLTVIFITHDLGVVANVADRIAVMYAGKIVEYGTSEDIFYSPAHPYTWALLSSMPDLDTKDKLEAIPGTPPDMLFPPKGDAFAVRNKYALKIDFEEMPPFFDISPTHKAATWLLHPDAPKVEPPKIILDRIERMQRNGGVNNG